jgi:hypothetical protein
MATSPARLPVLGHTGTTATSNKTNRKDRSPPYKSTFHNTITTGLGNNGHGTSSSSVVAHPNAIPTGSRTIKHPETTGAGAGDGDILLEGKAPFLDTLYSLLRCLILFQLFDTTTMTHVKVSLLLSFR